MPGSSTSDSSESNSLTFGASGPKFLISGRDGELCDGPCFPPRYDTRISITYLTTTVDFTGELCIDYYTENFDAGGPYFDGIFLYQGVCPPDLPHYGDSSASGTFVFDVEDGDEVAFGIYSDGVDRSAIMDVLDVYNCNNATESETDTEKKGGKKGGKKGKKKMGKKGRGRGGSSSGGNSTSSELTFVEGLNECVYDFLESELGFLGTKPVVTSKGTLIGSSNETMGLMALPILGLFAFAAVFGYKRYSSKQYDTLSQSSELKSGSV